ncbi:MAG TPA: hypothetical protein VHG92_14375 [Afifellaceae bacterium]|nr:hypothetical protein [Afifellaceae bacterium]
MRPITLLLAAWALSSATAAPAAAQEEKPQEIPSFNTSGQCRTEANRVGFYRLGDHDRCLTGEAQGLRGLRSSWDQIPPGIRKDCSEIASYHGQGSYETLARCVDDKMAEVRKYMAR